MAKYVGGPDAPAQKVVATLTSGTAGYTPGKAISCKCTVAGDVTFTLSGGDTIDEALAVGSNIFPYSVTSVTNGSGTTATYKNLV